MKINKIARAPSFIETLVAVARFCKWDRFVDDVDVQGEDQIVSWGFKTCKSEILEADWEKIDGVFCPDCGKRIKIKN